MQAHWIIDEPVPSSWNRQHLRLAVCMAISAAAVCLMLAVLEWPIRSEFARLVPLVLEVTLQRAPATRQPEVRPPEPREQPRPEPAAPAASTEPGPTVAPAAPAQAAVPRAPHTAASVDWYEALEQAAADVIARATTEPQSMDPAFDELRRIAAVRYAGPRTGKPQPVWDAEKDLYGRTLLRRGNTYLILDDPSLTNRYAFETFERHMLFVSIPIGKARPKNLPWVASIRARYAYMREPDELPVLKAALPGVRAN